ncbi:MAG TPA: peptidoglycan-associated lipoprotein Pal [Candidatus Aquilonibacter sp.]|nr:peptidoglycan-associated lipoprotein Pal [Candidatus Aquilonibacter sp.]
MKVRSLRRTMLFSGLVVLVSLAAGCKHKVAATAPAPTPAPTPQPTVTINASPDTLSSGQSTTLSWSSTNATNLTIDPGVGSVSPQGTTPVSPTGSTTYTITATGPGGNATASTRVTVNVASAAAPPPAAAPNVSELFQESVQDAFFDTDKSDLRDDARASLTRDAEFLRSYPQVKVSIEGHCDERGSTEYNLGLGQRRADAAKNFLISLGISTDRMTTTSWGKERPFCTDHTESCWQQNRRAHFVQAQ